MFRVKFNSEALQDAIVLKVHVSFVTGTYIVNVHNSVTSSSCLCLFWFLCLLQSVKFWWQRQKSTQKKKKNFFSFFVNAQAWERVHGLIASCFQDISVHLKWREPWKGKVQQWPEELCWRSSSSAQPQLVFRIGTLPCTGGQWSGLALM